MYKNTCKYCNKEIIVEKQQSFASHVAACNPDKRESIRKRIETLKKLNPINTYYLNCIKCQKEYDLEIKKLTYEKGKYRKTCSSKCSNGKNWTEEHRQKLSAIAKKSENVIKANGSRKGIKKNSPKDFLIREEISKKVIAKNKNLDFDLCNMRRRFIDGYTFYVDKCNYCNEEIIHINPTIRKYHSDCWKKCSGGYKEGSVKNFKSGTYKGYYCDSSWELAFIIYNLEHGIKFIRNTEGFPYVYGGNSHNYHPDYILEDGSYVEIKNYKSDLTDAKLENFPHKIKIMYKEDLEHIFEYVINKYGKNYISLYEKN